MLGEERTGGQVVWQTRPWAGSQHRGPDFCSAGFRLWDHGQVQWQHAMNPRKKAGQERSWGGRQGRREGKGIQPLGRQRALPPRQEHLNTSFGLKVGT